MPFLVSYSIKNAFARKLTGTLTVAGIALVVFVFCAVLMLADGLEQTLADTGSDSNIKVVRKSANTELVSILARSSADIIKADPAVFREPDGTPRFASEVVALIALEKKSDSNSVNVNVRGGSTASFVVRPPVKIIQGRMFNPGSSEIIVGTKVAKGYWGAEQGERLKFGGREWTIVGIFEAAGSGFESEVWVDADQLGAAFNWPTFSSLTFQIVPGTDFVALKDRLESDRRLTVEVMTEREYFQKQSASFTTFIRVLGMFIAIVFSLGAVVGAMITMYAAVANRTLEIGTLRSLGFSRSSVLSAFLTESLVISLVGGAIGIAMATFLRYLEISTTNFDSFAEIAFSFKMSPDVAMQALIFSVIMGLVGGFLPAVRASRLRIVQALKAR
jgi:ABC-type antimicrobial peptide transport system permease subunit